MIHVAVISRTIYCHNLFIQLLFSCSNSLLQTYSVAHQTAVDSSSPPLPPLLIFLFPVPPHFTAHCPFSPYRQTPFPVILSLLFLSLTLHSRSSSLPLTPSIPLFALSQEKFGIEPTDTKAKEELIKSYLEGLAWVLTYYHDGVCASCFFCSV